MFGSIFYHSISRKMVSVFGNMFNDIHIRRFDANNNLLQTIPVPIMYGPKAKYISLINREPAEAKTQISLPRISFAITNISHNPNRKINSILKNVNVTNEIMNTQFVEIPYDFEMELYIYVKTQFDGTQIIEQILPYFTPSFTPEVILIPEMGDSGKYDIKTKFNGSISIQDDYEGTAEEQRIIVYTLSFVMEGYMFGPVSNQKIIKRVIVDLIPNDNNSRESRIEIVGGLTPEGLPTTNPSLSIPWSEVKVDDPYGFITNMYDFDDGKVWDPISGTDK